MHRSNVGNTIEALGTDRSVAMGGFHPHIIFSDFNQSVLQRLRFLQSNGWTTHDQARTVRGYLDTVGDPCLIGAAKNPPSSHPAMRLVYFRTAFDDLTLEAIGDLAHCAPYYGTRSIDHHGPLEANIAIQPRPPLPPLD